MNVINCTLGNINEYGDRTAKIKQRVHLDKILNKTHYRKVLQARKALYHVISHVMITIL